VEWWKSRENKKVRAIQDLFTDGGTGQLKQGSSGLAIAIHSLKPLTLVKTEVPKKGQQEFQTDNKNQKDSEEKVGSHGSHRSHRSHSGIVIEQSHSTNTPSDPCDLDFSRNELQIHAIIQTLLKDQENFTEDDWVIKCGMWPNLGWKLTDAKKALKLLLQQGKLKELEPGRYGPASGE
jgi:hypothetical protein